MAIKQRGKGGKLSLYKRVPARYEAVEPRKFVWVALHTDSMTQATRKADAVWSEMIEAWEAKLAGDTADAEQRFKAARDLAAARGFRFLPVNKVAQVPLDELRDRMAAVPLRSDEPDMIEAAAVLGGAREPSLTVSRALDAYWQLAREKTLGKSPDQLRRWRNPRIKAVTNFIAVVGDKAVSEISTEDMLDFRSWWLDRIEAGNVGPGSANKDLIHLGEVLKTVNRMKRLGLALPLDGLSFKEGEAGQRPPFSPDWIRDKLVAKGALDGLNSEARAILLAMVNTGARPSEIANLTADRIRLESKVPHISIEGEDRQLKSAYARRVIPLCGVSQEAMRMHPDGFPRYRDKPGLSATVNKYLRENGLAETPLHTMYSLRHSFEDRMIAAGVDDRIRRDLFGHRLDRERYGKGATLEHLQEIVQALAF
ncbi:tyrosine-type recombinase/integrase [Paracoccus sp. MC1854]|uniref:tyrosine-type recombinase/integrase n=1 Tax=Paracoccus sp. MC1854 TaxID=2760306 RepID=UPI0016017464|nr:tyrosine-type recombinase/integrase [Paracoccus sp. MC1854]MBB1493023.1 tyrosine-type recombinase/integrase [Paracoccus sp. MC1854]